MEWNFVKINPNKIYKLPPGNYYIGDICYVLNDSIYDGVFGSYGYSSGWYTSEKGHFLVSGTYAGDGAYIGTDGFEYGVDAGIIGIVSESLIEDVTPSGRNYNFPNGVDVKMKNGVFTFKTKDFNLTIDTKQ